MKEIKLNDGCVAMVDDADFDVVSKARWFALRSGQRWFAVSRDGEDMARFVLGAKRSQTIGYRDGDGLNCQRANLIATSSGLLSQTLPSNNTSWFRGVSALGGLWGARITINGKQIFLGRFKTKEEARDAYKAAFDNHHGSLE